MYVLISGYFLVEKEIKTLTIVNPNTIIGDFAFADCTNLTEIHIEGTVYDVVWTTSPRHAWDMSLNKKAFLEMLKCGEGTIKIERTFSWN